MEEDDMIFDEEEMLDESPKVGGKYISISELESYTIKCLLTSQILLSRYIDLLKPSYFENASNKVLFKLIKNYYKDMGHKIPKDEVALRLEAMLPTKPGTEDKQKELRDNCKATVERVFSEEEVDQESANLNLKDFVFKRSAEESLDELINSVTGSDPSNYEQNQYYAIEKCIVRLSESVNIAVDASEPFTLSDIKKIPEIKKEGLGEGTRIVKFFLDSLNDTMEYGGINVGAVACVMAPPGTGKTTFLTNQGLFSAQQGLNVCHIFLGDMEKYDALIRYYSVFTEARYRKIEILNRNIEKRISAYKMLLKRYKKEDKQYKYYEKKIQEDEAVLHQNRLMDEKYKANKNMFSSKQLVSMSDEELELIYGRDEEYLKIANNIDVNVYAVGEMSMDALRQAIYNWQNQRKKHYDVIIIDYDSNLKQPADNMYESGGIIYDQAKNMAQVNKSVVFMASQPNKAYWKNEMIPLEACSESSKKQMIIDLLITVGRPEGVNTGIRKVFIPKNRRGKENEILHAKMNGETGFMYEISQEDYTTLKKQGYDPTLIISAGGMYGKKKKEDSSTEEQPVTNAALPETMKQVSL